MQSTSPTYFFEYVVRVQLAAYGNYAVFTVWLNELKAPPVNDLVILIMNFCM